SGMCWKMGAARSSAAIQIGLSRSEGPERCPLLPCYPELSCRSEQPADSFSPAQHCGVAIALSTTTNRLEEELPSMLHQNGLAAKFERSGRDRCIPDRRRHERVALLHKPQASSQSAALR